VDLEVHAGEVVCLLGPNGAGKTTTIEILEGFRLPSAGEVRVLGETPSTAGDAALPHGMQGYVSGQITYHSLSLIPSLLTILVPSFLLFDDLVHRGAGGWLTVAWVVVLALLATLPLGMIIGSVVPSTRKVGTWGMLPVLLLTAISGIFFPIQALWGWVQAVAQVFPTYWIGLGLRSAFLPDSAVTLELGDSWRTGATVAVLLAWAAFGALVTPRVLRRMARRQSGATVQEAREAALQWVR
jgi:ABC-2 type transport system permease protein